MSEDELIHDSDPASKVIRRGLSISVLQLDGTSCLLHIPGGPSRLIDRPGFPERQSMSCADLCFDNLLEEAFQLGVLIVAAKAQADRGIEPFEAAGAFILEPSL